MTNIELIDLKKEREKGFVIFSEKTKSILEKNQKNQQPIILFINRKALATSIVCEDCGFVFSCSNCDVPLTLHLIDNKRQLICHHCGFSQKVFDICPDCQSHRLKALGIGTERVALELKKINPSLNFIIFQSEKDYKEDYNLTREKIELFNKRKTPVLIGTDAIFKPQLKKVPISIVVSIDNLLFLPNYDSEEKVFSTLSRLKNLTTDQLIIQTMVPDKKIFTYFQNNQKELFYQEELSWREKYHFPPFYQLVKIGYEAKDEQKTLRTIQKIVDLLKNRLERNHLEKKFEVIGPTPAFVFKKKGYYHYHFILKMKYELEIMKNLSFDAGLNNLSPMITKEEIKFRNNLLKIIPSDFQIEVDPDDIL